MRRREVLSAKQQQHNVNQKAEQWRAEGEKRLRLPARYSHCSTSRSVVVTC